jgi:hypothetical protein
VVLTPEAILAWENLITTAVGLGVKSWSAIHAMILDSGVAADDAAIEVLRVKHDALRADIARAAGE